jgi:cholesterol transport system auxiliary component
MRGTVVVIRRAISWVGWSLLSCALAACVLPRSTDNPVHTFLLTIDESAWSANPRGAQPGIHGVLVVGLPQAEAGFEQPRMAYLRRPYEVNYYATNVWVDAPAADVGALAGPVAGATGLWRVVVSMPTAVRGDYRLDTSGLVLQQEFLQPPSRTRLQLRAQLLEMKEQRVLGVRSFEVLEPASSDDAYGGVQAANRAVTRVLETLNDWIASCLRGAGKDAC